MEKSFKLSLDLDKPDALRAELQFAKAEGRTAITVAMTVPNRFAHLTVAAAQAEVLRMAIADLEQERQRLEIAD